MPDPAAAAFEEGASDGLSEDIPGEAHGDWAATEQPPAPWPTATPAYISVLAIGLIGLVVVLAGEYRLGSFVIGGAVALAALLRAFLPESRVGMLAVRDRRVDTVVLSTLAAGVIVLALVVPPPS